MANWRYLECETGERVAKSFIRTDGRRRQVKEMFNVWIPWATIERDCITIRWRRINLFRRWVVWK